MDLLDFTNYIFKKSYNLTFVYFTIWGLILQLLYYIGVLKRYQESVLLVSLTVSFMGLILTYIYPEKLKLVAFDYVVSKNMFQVVDLIFHQIPLIIFLISYDTRIKPDNLIFGAIILLIYVLLNNPYDIYSFKCACAHKPKNNRYGSTDICKCRNKYNLGIGMIIVYVILIILSIKLKIFS